MNSKMEWDNENVLVKCITTHVPSNWLWRISRLGYLTDKHLSWLTQPQFVVFAKGWRKIEPTAGGQKLSHTCPTHLDSGLSATLQGKSL